MRKIFIVMLSLFLFCITVYAEPNHLIYNGNEKSNKIYLTFDDGYSQRNTLLILDTLERYDIPATFFIEGQFMQENPVAVKRIAEEQILANHTMCHCDITKLTNDEFISDIKEFEELAYSITGKEITKFFRPPMGYINEEKEKLLYDMGYMIFMWNVKIYDYVHNDDKGVDYVVNNIVKRVKNGSIILMHTLTDSNANALPIVIERLIGLGYEFSSLMDFKKD
ncbi:MAG: hypothetical protein E7176_00485 [Erysipelotrichaceae bacterium]|nr:hypothetical protein [Erysipelotrichaceae bacterium]